MNSATWELSGPRLLLARLIGRVKEGVSVVLRCGDTERPEIALQVTEGLRAGYVAVSTVDSTLPPLEALTAAAGLGPVAGTLDALCGNGLSAHCFVVTPESAESWTAWAGLVVRLQQRLRQVPTAERLTIVLIGSGFPSNVACDDVALASIWWNDAITRADVVSLADAVLPRKKMSRTLRSVLVHTIAAAALTDLDLVVDLSNQPLPEMAAPFESLRHWASRRGWDTPAAIPAVNFEGEVIEHPVSCALRGDRAAIHRLSWKAQLGVLLPWVEEQRLRLSSALAPWLPAEHEGTTRDQLEIGSIHYLLGCRQAPARLCNQVRTLRQVRNSLAHRTPLTFQDLDRSLRLIEDQN